MNMTPWFDGTQKPVKAGVYEVRHKALEKCPLYAYFGMCWAHSATTVEYAYATAGWTRDALQDKQWRGLSEESK